MFKKFLLLLVAYPFIVSSQVTSIEKVKFKVISSGIELTYDLFGELSQKFTVKAFLKRESVESLKFELKTVTGDIGEDVYAGTGKRIVWDYKKDYSVDSEVEDYYFEIEAEKNGSGLKWYYYVGAAVGGAVAAVLLLVKPEESSAQDGTTPQKIAKPPERP